MRVRRATRYYIPSLHLRPLHPNQQYVVMVFAEAIKRSILHGHRTESLRLSRLTHS
jgi:hypothetical protein